MNDSISQNQQNQTTKKILVVEDEKPLSKAMVVKLTKAGYQPSPAFNGEEALSNLKNQSYDLIFLDLLMPGMDGWDFLEQVQTMQNNTPIIVVSNLSQEEDIEKAKELGATDFFIKSDTSLAEIVERVQNILG